ncbi:formyltransferase family protein [Neorhizobium sp. NPDC001467]|uniref:formyltransferase family protein n=1 Tax=Neorhizobium sp. NPDC001467 TaxID=3390595 RepID=UPI003CFF0270
MAGNAVKRIVFLCSGGGGNLSFLHHAIRQKWLPDAEIPGVITDRQCAANDFCDRVGIRHEIVKITAQDQAGLLDNLVALEPDVIVTTVHRIIGRQVIDRFEDKLVNLHYSLLPAFPGLIGTAPVQAALDHQALFAGVTVHLVNEQVDAGQPLVQAAIPLIPNDTLETLMPIVFRSGCLALLRALSTGTDLDHSTGMSAITSILGRVCLINGGGPHRADMADDQRFWDDVAASVSMPSA